MPNFQEIHMENQKRKLRGRKNRGFGVLPLHLNVHNLQIYCLSFQETFVIK